MPVHRHLHDKRGSVYALSSELDAWLKSRKLEAEEEPKELPETRPSEPTDLQGSKRGLPRGLAIGFAAALVVLLAVGYFLARTRAGTASESKIKSLAVLPLANLSGDPAQEYLAEGMTEEIIGRLSMIGGLRVISRTSVMQFKERRASVPEIAKTLNVDAIVEGSVIREGDRVRIHAQLIRAATDEHFWSETYDRNLGDALELQSQVAQAIAERVKVTLTGAERTRLVAAHPVSPEVYESYLKGEFALNSPRPLDLKKSVPYFQDAITKTRHLRRPTLAWPKHTAVLETCLAACAPAMCARKRSVPSGKQ